MSHNLPVADPKHQRQFFILKNNLLTYKYFDALQDLIR